MSVGVNANSLSKVKMLLPILPKNSCTKLELLFSGCLSHSSGTVKRHQNQGNSYKRKDLTGVLLRVSES